MDKKIIYIIVSIFAFGGVVAFFIFKKPSKITPGKTPSSPSPSLSPFPLPSLSPFPDIKPKNLLEDAYFMSKKMNKDTDDIKNRLCKTLDAKKLFPDVC